MSNSPLQLDSLPDDILHSIFDFFSTFELLQTFVHTPTCKSWQHMWNEIPCIEIDLERDVGEMMIRSRAAANLVNGTDSTSAVLDFSQTEQQARMDVSRLIARKKYEYLQLIQLVKQHSHELQVLCLDNFGAILTDEIIPIHQQPIQVDATVAASATNEPFLFQSLLAAHSSSLVNLSLIGSAIKRIELGSEFGVLESLDLSKCRSLSDPLLKAPALTSLDLSRTLLNDFELLRILPNLPKLKYLRVIGCKNLRKLDGDDPRKLYGEQVPELKMLDFSNTGIIDVSVNALVKYCGKLEILYLNDCFDLRAPKILSSSLLTLSMRQCDQLKQTTRIECEHLKEIDLSKTNIRDAMVNGDSLIGAAEGVGRISIPNIEVLVLNNCYELLTPMFNNSIIQNDSSSNGNSNASSSLSPAPASPAPIQLYPNLREVDISMCYGLGNVGLLHLLEMSPNVTYLNLQQCKEVRSSWKSHADDPEEEERFDIFPPHLHQLHELVLRGCALNDENLRLFLQSASAQSLTTLNLRNCFKITGKYIQSTTLVELDLRLTLITDAILAELLFPDHCPNLLTLFVGQCEKLIQPIIKHPRLVELDISGCGNLRSIVIEAAHLKRLNAALNLALRHLDLAQCGELTLVDIKHSALANIIQPVLSIEAAVDIISTEPTSLPPQEVTSAPKPLKAHSHEAYREYQAMVSARQDLNVRGHGEARPTGHGPGLTTVERAYAAAAALDAEENSATAAAGMHAIVSRSAPMAVPSTTSTTLSSPSTSSSSSTRFLGSSPPKAHGLSPTTSYPMSTSPGRRGSRNEEKDGMGLESRWSTKNVTSQYNLHDNQPLHSTIVSRRQQQQWSTHQHPMTHTPPKMTTSESVSSATPPGSPSKRSSVPVGLPLSPSSSASSTLAGSPPRNKSRHPSTELTTPNSSSTIRTTSTTVSVSTTSNILSNPTTSSSPSAIDRSSTSTSTSLNLSHHGIRSIDLCMTEERIKELELKLLNELARASYAQQMNQSPSIQTDLKNSIYGLKKQLAIQKAKLKKEQKQLTLASTAAATGENMNEEDERADH